jgi:hypothetical protein
LQLLAFCMGRHRRLGEESCVRWLPKDLMKLIGGLVVREDANATGAVTVTYYYSKHVTYYYSKERRDDQRKPRKVEMRSGLTTVARATLAKEQQPLKRMPRALYLTARLNPHFWFPQFSELPDLALQAVAKHLSSADVCRLEMASKGTMRRLEQVYAYQFCSPSMWMLKDVVPDLSTEAGRAKWHKLCKDKALQQACIRTVRGRTSLAYPYLKEEAAKSFCLQQ